MTPAKDITAADVNLREAHTPNESPAPQRTVPEWAVKAAVACWESLQIDCGTSAENESCMNDLAAIIAKHAHPPPAHGGLVERLGAFLRSCELNRREATDHETQDVEATRVQLLTDAIAALTAPPPVGNDGALARVEAHELELRRALTKSYPMEPSGICSRHKGGDKTGECDLCWPDLWELVGGHAKVNGELVAERNQLRADLERVQAALDEQTGVVHSCSIHCQRPLCVMRRDLQAAVEGERALAEALEAVARYPVASTYPDGPCVEKYDMEEIKNALANHAKRIIDDLECDIPYYLLRADAESYDAMVEQMAKGIAKCWPGAIPDDIWVKEAKAALAAIGITKPQRPTP